MEQVVGDAGVFIAIYRRFSFRLRVYFFQGQKQCYYLAELYVMSFGLEFKAIACIPIDHEFCFSHKANAPLANGAAFDMGYSISKTAVPRSERTLSLEDVTPPSKCSPANRLVIPHNCNIP